MKKFTLKNKKRLLMLMGLSVATGIGVIATAAACTPEKKPSKKTTVTAETSAFENHKEKETMSKEDVENEMRERDKTPESSTYVPPKSPEESSAKPKSEKPSTSETSSATPSTNETRTEPSNSGGTEASETGTSSPGSTTSSESGSGNGSSTSPTSSPSA